MEILKRVHEIDENKARDVLDKILLGKVSHREVQAAFQNMLGPSSFSSPRGGPDGLPQDSAAESACGATFFRNYWGIVEKRGTLASSIAKDVRFLELHSIGVVVFDRNNPERLHVLLKPELPAEPDRQPVGIADAMQQGILGLMSV